MTQMLMIVSYCVIIFNESKMSALISCNDVGRSDRSAEEMHIWYHGILYCTKVCTINPLI